MKRLAELIGIVCVVILCSFKVTLADEPLSGENWDTADLEKIVVTASRIEQTYKYSTHNISIITKGDIESSGATEIVEILDLLPAVDIIEYGSYGSTRSIHTRGASSSQVLTLIDGRPVNTPRDGITDFNQIPLSNIERIEVLRGPASNIYGSNAVGGVINIITKKGLGKMQTQILSKFGSFSSKLLSLTHGYKPSDFDYFLAYDYLASHGHRDNSDHLSNNLNSKFGYQLNEENRIEISSGYYNSETGSPGLASNMDLDDRLEVFKKHIDLTYRGKIIEGQDILLKLYHNFDRTEFIETFNPMDKSTHQIKTYAIDTQISQVLFDIFRSSVGYSHHQHRLNSSTSAKHSYYLNGFYFESEIDFFERNSVKFGARWDDYSNFGNKISPSVSLNFWINDQIKLHSLAAKSFRAPTFNDLYWPREDWGIWGGVEGNANLGPESAVSYESGISGYFIKGLKTDITFFKTNFDDLIIWTVDDSWWWRPENVSSASIKGFELEAEYTIKEQLKANFNYSYLETKDKNTKKWLIYRPRHLYKLKVAYSPKPQYEFSFSTIYKTKRYSNASNTSFLKHYFVANLNFSYKINDSLQISFEAKNLFNKKYQEERDYPMPGRAFYGGIKLCF